MFNNCEITIELDDPERSYVAGDSITGTARVTTDAEIDGAELAAVLEWRTHGFGNHAGEVVVEKMVHVGDWPEGMERSYDFSIEAPAGPFTYHGHLVNVDWSVRARADVPWDFDPADSKDLVLEPANIEGYDVGDSGIRQSRVEGAADPASVDYLRLILGAVILVVSCGTMAPVFTQPIDGLPWAALLFVGIIGAAVWLMYSAVRNAIAGSRLGDLEVEVEPGAVAPGDELKARVRFEPDGTVDLNRVTVELKGRERATSGHGTSSTTRYERLHAAKSPIPESVDATTEAGATAEYTASLEVPESAPYTFHADNNHVEWQVEFHIDIAVLPDFVHTEPLLVRPSVGASQGPVSEEEARPDPRGTDEEDVEVVW